MVKSTHLPFFTNEQIGAWPERATIEDEYFLMLAPQRGEIAAIIAVITGANDGGVLFHCHSGKDRTGLIAALILALLRVPDADIIADYVLSRVCLQPLQDEWLENGPGERVWREEASKWLTSSPATTKAVLTHLRRKYGGAESYVLDSGLSTTAMSLLRERLLRAR